MEVGVGVVDVVGVGAVLVVDVAAGAVVEVDTATPLPVGDAVEGDVSVDEGPQANSDALSANSETDTTFEQRSRCTGPERTVGRYALADGKWRSLASAPALGAGGRGFESRLPDGWP